MGLEAVTYIDDFNVAWPLGTDQILNGDNHIRNIKTALVNTFPNLTGPMTLTQAQLNNVAIQNLSNSFSTQINFTTRVAPVALESALPGIIFNQTGGDLNEKFWGIYVSSMRMRFIAAADAGGGPSTEFLTVYRAGGAHVPTQMDFNVPLTRSIENHLVAGNLYLGSTNQTLAASSPGHVTMQGEELGFLGIPQISKSVNYTAVLNDMGKCLYHPSGAAAHTFTIPANASVAAEIGSFLAFQNESANALGIAITTDTLELAGTGAGGAGAAGLRSLARHGIAMAYKHTATKWKIAGIGIT